MTKAETFLILLGGDLQVDDRFLSQTAGLRTIAADGGMRHAKVCQVEPELWVGDFDSASAMLLAAWPKVERRSFPAAKAMTDGELAVQSAIERGASALVLAGGLKGERSDLIVHHLLMAVRLFHEGVSVMVTSGEEEAYPLGNMTRTFQLPKGSLFSILGFSDLTGITIEGARYPLTRFDLPLGSSRTLSNVVEDTLHVSVASGLAVLLARPFDRTGS